MKNSFIGAQVDRYQLLHDAYYGVGLFDMGAGLIKHPRESENNYKNRQALAYYLNYTGPIVNASVDPIFKDEIRREYKDTERFKLFLTDVDRVGTDLQDYIRKIATLAKLYGVIYVVVDNVANDELDYSIERNNQARKLPFLSYVTPSQVTEWAFDEQGNITLFSYDVTYQKSEDEVAILTYQWTPETFEVYEEVEQQGKIGNIANEKELIRSGPNPLGIIPIVPWSARNYDTQDIKPPSEFLSIAQTNFHIYQLCSWHTQLLRDQAFSILTMPDTGGNEDITIGTSNVLTYDPQATHTPSFISPDAGPANMLTDQIDRLIKEMYRMSGIDSVVGVQQARSGVAKQWEFERTNQRLADFAVQCESAEMAIIKLYEMWTGESTDFVCTYPREFKITDVEDNLQNAMTALELGFNSQEFKIEVLKKVLEAYMPNLEADIYDTIIEQARQSIEEDEQENTYRGKFLEGDDDDDRQEYQTDRDEIREANQEES